MNSTRGVKITVAVLLLIQLFSALIGIRTAHVRQVKFEEILFQQNAALIRQTEIAEQWREAFLLLQSTSTDLTTLLQSDTLYPIDSTNPFEVLSYIYKVKDTLPIGSPFHSMYYITSPFKDGVLSHKYRIHRGIDLVPTGDGLVFPIADGVITEMGFDKLYGKWILISHGNGFETFYAHLATIYWQNLETKAVVGESVTTRSKIGMYGNTGTTTGPHLHFEVRYYGNVIDPENYLLRDLNMEATHTQYKEGR